MIEPDRATALLSDTDREPWILVPLGNPGAEYADTRHNLGRLLLQRWVDTRCRKAGPVHTFATGTVYALRSPFLALVPGTYMNLSGQVVEEAVKAGFALDRMVLLHDDKDLPLGYGRFRTSGSDGGHNGLKSVFAHAGTEAIPRLRLGIGPIQRPLHDYVLGPWEDEEWELINGMDAPFAQFLELLAGGHSPLQVMSQVNADAFWRPEPPAVKAQEAPADPGA